MVLINDIEVESNDWVGAFNGNVCVGARQWDTSLCGGGICEVPVMGDDGSDDTNGYMQSGDIPTFKIYDASENLYYTAESSENSGWFSNGMPIAEILSANVSIYGCTDPDYCNYDPLATEDDGSCDPSGCLGWGQNEGDIIITEFFFNKSAGNLPEYVELFNKTDSTIDLNGWKLGIDGFQVEIDVPFNIAPQDYVVILSASGLLRSEDETTYCSSSHYGFPFNVCDVQVDELFWTIGTFSDLPNSSGSIKIWNNSSTPIVIDSVTYSSEANFPIGENIVGMAVEFIQNPLLDSTHLLNDIGENWQSSLNHQPIHPDNHSPSGMRTSSKPHGRHFIEICIATQIFFISPMYSMEIFMPHCYSHYLKWCKIKY